MRKRIGYLVLAAVISGGLVACCIDDKNVDPTNNVSAESYRACVVKVQSNLVGNIIPSLRVMRDSDLASPSPQHTAKWWDAKIGLVSDTATLCSDTLAGSNVGIGK